MAHTFDPKKLQRADIAKIFGVHPTTVSRWKPAGCPCSPDGKIYSAPDVHKWLVDQATADFGKDREPQGDSPALERYREARAAMAEIDLKEREGELISREDVSREWALRVAEISAGLEFLADRLPPLLVGKEREEIRKIIADEVYKLRETYSRRGKYCE